jgi:drug/metabolite transporter (DMT)-like permease
MNTSMDNKPSLVRLLAAFAAVYIIWGSTYLAIRFAIETMPPFLMIGARFFLGGLLFYAFSRLRGARKPSGREWRSAWLVGTLMLCGGTGLVAWAEQTVPSGLTALLVGSMPLWIVLLDWLARSGGRPSGLTMMGIVLGISGVALLVIPSDLAEFSIDPIGAGAVMLAAVFWAYGSLLSRSAAMPASPTLALGMKMIGGSVSLLMVGLVTGELGRLSFAQISTFSWLAFAYLVIPGGVAFAAYIWLLRNTTPAKASTYAFVNPAVALFLGVFLGNEPFDSRTLFAALVIIGAVAIIVLQSRRLHQRAVAPPPKAPTHAHPGVTACQAGREVL